MWQKYRKTATQEMRPYVPGEDLAGISVSAEDTPELGGMIARNPDNHSDQWYVAKEFFAKNYEVVGIAPQDLQNRYGKTSNALTGTLGQLLEKHGSSVDVGRASIILGRIGYLKWVDRGDWRCPRLVKLGLQYGRNEPDPREPCKTYMLFCVKKFPELLERINAYERRCWSKVRDA